MPQIVQLAATLKQALEKTCFQLESRVWKSNLRHILKTFFVAILINEEAVKTELRNLWQNLGPRQRHSLKAQSE